MDSHGRLFIGDRVNNRIQIIDQDGKLPRRMDAVRAAERRLHRQERHHVFGRLSPATGTARSTPASRGIRIGSAKDGKVFAFIPEIAPGANMPEGIAADAQGVIYGGWTGKMNMRRWVKAVTQ